jgi:hypothetical protein
MDMADELKVFADLVPGDVFIIPNERSPRMVVSSTGVSWEPQLQTPYVVLSDGCKYSPSDASDTFWATRMIPDLAMHLPRDLPKSRHVPPKTPVVKTGHVELQ